MDDEFDLNLTEEEERFIHDYYFKPNVKGYQSLSASDRIRSWDRFVSDIGNGLDMYFNEYTVMIFRRGGIEKLIRHSPEPLRSKIIAKVKPIDDRFLELTREIDNPTMGPLIPSEKIGWWCYRVPKKMQRDLEQHLKEIGII
jgi:hypothetical protein